MSRFRREAKSIEDEDQEDEENTDDDNWLDVSFLFNNFINIIGERGGGVKFSPA